MEKLTVEDVPTLVERIAELEAERDALVAAGERGATVADKWEVHPIFAPILKLLDPTPKGNQEQFRLEYFSKVIQNLTTLIRAHIPEFDEWNVDKTLSAYMKRRLAGAQIEVLKQIGHQCQNYRSHDDEGQSHCDFCDYIATLEAGL